MNQFYEIMFIVNPDLGDEDREKLLGRLKTTIGKNKGDLIRMDDMGTRSLAYKIKKKPRGHYFLLYLEGPGAMVPEIERFLRIDENILRYIPIKLEEGTTREDLEPKAEPQEEPADTSQQEEVKA
ncbi:MAG: 30S ribosomal protein S6 [Desulfomonilia bacterium]